MAPAAPRATAITDAVTGPGLAVAPEPAVRAAGSLLARGLGGTADGTRLRVDGYLLRTALRDPDRLAGPDRFAWSPRTARRSLGLAAARRCACGLHATPAGALDEVVEEAVADTRRGLERPGSLACWLAQAPPGARAAVRAEALTWATHLVTSLDWPRLGRCRLGGRDDWWDGPVGSGVVLRGRAEVRTEVDGVGVLFCLLGGTPDELSPAELGLAALVSAVGGGTPGRVVGWWPQAGRLMVTAVDASLLLDTADHVVRAVAATRLVRSGGRSGGGRGGH